MRAALLPGAKVAEDHDRDVVALRGALREGSNRRDDLLHDRLSRGFGRALRDLLKPALTEILTGHIEGFGHAVAEEHDDVPRLELFDGLHVRRKLEQPNDGPADIEVTDAGLSEDNRRIVSRVAVRHLAFGAENAEEQRHESGLDTTTAQGFVEARNRA